MRSYTWNTTTDWNLWSNPSGESRVVSNALKLPFHRIPHQGIGTAATENLLRYRFGQLQSLQSQESVSLTLEIPSGSPISVVEDGIHSTSRYGRVRPTTSVGSTLNYPKTTVSRAYISFWFKSSLTNYSSRAYLAVYHSGVTGATYNCSSLTDGLGGDVGWAIIIDTDGAIKAIVRDSVSISARDRCISPVNGNVYIDDKWHHVMFFIGRNHTTVPGPTEFLLVIDNDFSTTYTQITDSRSIAINQTFSIGSSDIDAQYGFLGTIDEFVFSNWTGTNSGSSASDPAQRFGLTVSDFQQSYRFTQNIYTSPVIDTKDGNSRLNAFIATFDNPNNSSLQFSFRANSSSFSQSDTSVDWSAFTLPENIISGEITDLHDLGISVTGRYIQVRVLMSPSNDALSSDTPSLQSLQILVSAATTEMLHASHAAYVPGSLLGQRVDFSGAKNIDKVTLQLTINNKSRKTLITSTGDNLSFQASNFQNHRDGWVFHPEVPSWLSSGTPVRNSLQDTAYPSDHDAVVNAPYLEYHLYIASGGVYDIWAYGLSNGFFWSWNGDENNLHRSTLGLHSSPRWAKIGQIYENEGGEFKFGVYLSAIGTTIFDQWFITKNTKLQDELNLIGSDAYVTPFAISEGPFNTVVRLRPINSDVIDPYGSDTSISWLSSINMLDSGRFNYEIRNHSTYPGATFSDGVLLEYWQIGGNKDYFAAWAYSFTESSLGASYRSSDYGLTIEDN